jgi:flagellar export protein FliJ
MAVFRFSLQPVLRQRELAEREQQRRVAQVERERLALEGLLRAENARLAEERAELARLTSGRSPGASALRGQMLSVNAAQAEAQALAVRLAGVLRRMERERAALAERAAARRAMELLRDQRRADFEAALAAAEARMTDDIVSAAAARRGGPALGGPALGGHEP